jgi:predicted  nucleic acid-binding Zn-ribbon protein
MAELTTDTPTLVQLRALSRLQHLDSKLDQLRKLRGDLPDEIAELEAERDTLEERKRALAQEAQDDAVSHRQYENEMRDSENAIRKYTEQQNQVRNNREYDALSKEIEASRQRIIDAQGNIDQIARGVEPRQMKVEETEARLAELNEMLAAKRTELSGVMDETRSEEQGLAARRDEAAQDVDETFSAMYNRLRKRLRDGRAVVPLDRGAAGGFAIPPQQQIEIRQRAHIPLCEHTGRLIVDQELFEEVRQQVEEELASA